MPAIRVGDHVALDFLNSIASPQGEPLEWIADGAAYLQWLEDSGTVQPQQRKAALKSFSQAQLNEIAAEARQLREWFRKLLVTVKARCNSAITPRDISKLNGYLTAATFSRQLERDADDRLGLAWKSRASGVRMFLFPTVEAMAELLCEEDHSLVSRCEGSGCTLWFYDRTKSHHRRWCSQAVCGNRARVNAFRQRSRASS